jgi:hypothetical protein
MGNPDYSYSTRSAKTQLFAAKGADGKHKVSLDQVFEQNKKRETHESMLPSKAIIRESRDSENHPTTVPIIIGLDITGSMQDIPENLIREGLPKLVSALMKRGVAHPAIMFMAIGDSRCDRGGTFQVGQFESGDKEMDMWLERMWLRGGGGGNGSESYNWPYYYARNYVVTDAWEKRKEKGYIFTIGDDHCQTTLTESEMKEVMVDNVKGEIADTSTLVKGLQEQWHVYHINVDEPGGRGSGSRNGGTTNESWTKLLGGENVIDMGRRDYQGIADKIADIIASRVTSKDFSNADKEEKELAALAGDKKDDKTDPSTQLW